MRTRVPSALAAFLAAALLFVPVARADGDPASDVLLGENVFYPYSPPTSAAMQKTLDARTLEAKRAGLPLKVALIGTPVDLGVIPDLFGKPQKYADFLDQEISLKTRQPLLVVMAAGYGAVGLPASAVNELAKLPKPAGRSSDALASAAIEAVGKLAAAAGHPIAGGGGSGGGSTRAVLLAVLVLAGVLTASALLVLRRRGARLREP